MSKSSIYAIIPARGGSKGLPRKNIYPLAGKPLIAYTIQAALKSVYIERCFVSTEDEEICEISRQYGAEIINRPMELAQDFSSSVDVIKHSLNIIEQLGEPPDIIALLQPTSPLRNELHLSNCIEEFLSSNASSSFSVTEVEHHPYKMLYIKDNRLIPLFDRESLNAPRQNLKKIYRQNGAIYLMKSKEFLKNESIYIEPVIPYIMSDIDSIDIDNYTDIIMAEALLKKYYI